MQIYGNFEGIPLYKCIVWVGNIMTLVGSTTAVGSTTPVGSTTNSIRKINPLSMTRNRKDVDAQRQLLSFCQGTVGGAQRGCSVCKTGLLR